MLISKKNKEFLQIDDFILRCAIGKNGIRLNKTEGDKATPSGKYSLGKLYYRADRVKKPITKIPVKVIKKNIGWCDDPESKYYNKEILINKKIKHEKLFRRDNFYDYFIVINYNIKKVQPYKGSAIFIHLTKNYKPTAGCVALKKKDFIILTKLINKKTKINIF
tara:strand:+ start:1678 stop:2169 length:492 start_codon:yes stop_codon:yes gene_type:complete